MRKLIIGIILIIPLLVLSSVFLTTNVIAANGIYIAVERVELNENELTLSLNSADGNYYSGLSATVYPSSAQNKNIIWTISDSTCTTPSATEDTTIAEIDENGVITLLGFGHFRVVATSEDGNKIDSCFVEVIGDSVDSVQIYSTANTIKTGEKLQLTAVISSADARNKKVYWSSNNADIATIDSNGIVTAIKTGFVSFTVVTDDGGYSDTIGITVEQGVAIKGDKVYITTNSIEINKIASENVVVVTEGSAAYISGGILYLNGESLVTVSAGDTYIDVIVVNSYDLTFLNLDIIKKTNCGYLKIGNYFVLSAIYADSFNNSFPNVTYSSSDENIASVTSQGFVKGLEAGIVTITAESGDSSVSYTFEVVKPVTLLALNNTASSDRLGIAAERIYGNYTIEADGTVSNEFAITILRPTEADYNQFIYTSSNPTVADFSDSERPNVLIFNTENKFDGKKEILINVKPRFSMYEMFPVSANYTLKLVDGYNVDTFEEYNSIMASGNNIVLQATIAQPAQNCNLRLSSDLYGNGFMVYADITENVGRSSVNLINIVKDDVTVENVILRHGCALSADATLDEYMETRWCILVSGNMEHTLQNINIRYCVLENAMNNIEVQASDVTITGCIFRNSAASALFMYAVNPYTGKYSNIYLKNNVFSHCYTVPISIIVDMLDCLNHINDYTTYEKYLEITNSGKCTIEIDGFLDIYNWRKLDELVIFKLPADLVSSSPIFATLDSGLTKTIQTEISGGKHKNLEFHLSENGEDVVYYHVGMVVIGGVAPIPSTSIINYENCGFQCLTIDKYSNALFNNLFKYPIYLYSYNKDNYDVGPYDEINYDFEESAQLYEDLRNGRE